MVSPNGTFSQFSNVHNHEVQQDYQVCLLPAYRKIQESDQERILLMSKTGFPVNRIVKVLELEKGVRPGQLPFIGKDVRNFVLTYKKTVQENDALLTEKRETEIVELVEACKAMVHKDAKFSYDYTTDENGKVGNIIWSGDVVHFDYTYWSIIHGMLLGLWFGIDNHGNAILFYCALLQDESSNSFAWAFQTFLRFMKGRRPQTIVTDMDIGLRDAISSELSGTKHVISIWHVLSKISTWFSFLLGSQYTDFKAEFEMLFLVESTEEFVNRWDLLVARFGLASDKHIALLFSYRGFWSLAYTRNYFLARTLAAEFSQSLVLFMKRVITANTCLQVFFEQVGWCCCKARFCKIVGP